MKAKELRQKSPKELEKLLNEKREYLRVAKFKKAGGELKNVREILESRRAIAQVLTLQREEK